MVVNDDVSCLDERGVWAFSRAGLFLQWDWGIGWRFCWLSGRHRWQASSHRDAVHLAGIGRLCGRHRQQAGSYNGIGGIWWRFVGWQAVIASKPAPTMGLDASGGGLLAGRPSSPASRLLQWDWTHLVEVCWLAGRHRQQAGSYNGIGGIWWRFVGWQAGIASKPAPTMGLVASGRDWLVGWQAVIASKPAPTMGLEASGGGLLAGRPASPASRLLQWDWRHLVEVCWLAGRHRQQAGSYNGIGGIW
jgi:hypothetical protein